MSIYDLARKFEQMIKMAEYEKTQMEKYGDFIVNFLSIGRNHPKFDWAVNKIKEMLLSEDGREAFETVFPVALMGLSYSPVKDIEYKLSLFIPFLHGKLKIQMIEWLTPEYAKQYLHDPDPEIQKIVEKILGIDYHPKSHDLILEKSISEDEKKTPELPAPPKTREEKDRLLKQVQELANKFDVQFGNRKNPNLN